MKRRCLTSHSKCNRCQLADFQRAAKESNRVLTLRPKPIAAFPDGQDVFIAPADTPQPELPNWWAGWLGSVPESCEC